jgi:Lon protease-like protein
MRHIPLFPLQVVLFPGMPLPLNIFEPRYKKMVRECLASETPFGIVYTPQLLETTEINSLTKTQIGCLARIIHINAKDNADGSYELMTIGTERFRISAFHGQNIFPTATVESLPLEQGDSIALHRSAAFLRLWLRAYLEILWRTHPYLKTREQATLMNHLPEAASELLFFSAAALQIPSREKQQLLEIVSGVELAENLLRLTRRELFLLGHLVQAVPAKVNRGAWLN